MHTTILYFTKPIPTSPTHLLPLTQPILLSGRRITTIKATSNEGGDAPGPPPEPAVQIRFKRGSRRRARQQEEDDGPKQPKVSVPKDWESMTFSEKALELYVGEKGLLFWINKFAYASIYITIGAWILFRFVGPALNLYQLDTPPLSPTAILK